MFRSREKFAAGTAEGSSLIFERSMPTVVEAASPAPTQRSGGSPVTSAGRPSRRKSVSSTTISTSIMGRGRPPARTVIIVPQTRLSCLCTCGHTLNCGPLCVSSVERPSSFVPPTARMWRDTLIRAIMCVASATRPSRWRPSYGSIAASTGRSGLSSARYAP